MALQSQATPRRQVFYLKFGDFLHLELTNLNQWIVILSHIIVMVLHDQNLRLSTTNQYSFPTMFTNFNGSKNTSLTKEYGT